MILSKMVTMLRRRIRDERKHFWTNDQDLVDELNLSAQFIADAIENLSDRPRAALSTVDVVFAAADKEKALPAAFIREYKVWEIDGSGNRTPCKVIHDKDEDLYDQQDREDVCDRRYVYFSTNATAVPVIGLPQAATGALTFRVKYFLAQPTYVTMTDDNKEYLFTPKYHHLAVLHSAIELLGQDVASQRGVAQSFAMQWEAMTVEVSTPADMEFTEDDSVG